MSNRTLRVNELVQRELSDILRKHHQSEAVAITITGVRVSPDLHEGKVFIAITGDEALTKDRLKWLRAKSKEFRFELGRRIVLKHMPVFSYEIDTATARGNRILQVLDEISEKEKSSPAAVETPPPAEA